MDNLIFEFLDKTYGGKIHLNSYIMTLKYNFINEKNEKILGYESLGEDGTVIVIKKMSDNLNGFFGLNSKQSEKMISEWFVSRYGDENKNSIKKIFEHYKNNTNVSYQINTWGLH